MKITVLGAAGNVGRRIVAEALERGHQVTAVVRDQSGLAAIPDGAHAEIGDATSVADVSILSKERDVVVNATRPPAHNNEQVFDFTKSLMDGMVENHARLIVVGGAATLVVPGTGGRRVLEDANYLPTTARHIGRASAAQYEACLRESRVNWTYLSPPATLAPGDRTGQYRTGLDELILDEEGSSRISTEDLAVAIVDEIESPKHRQQRFTVAY